MMHRLRRYDVFASQMCEVQRHLLPYQNQKATFSLISSLLSFLWKRQFERREKNEKRKVKRTNRNDNLLSKIVVSFCERAV